MPKHQGNQRAAHLFAGQQLEVSQLLPRAYLEPRPFIARKTRRPLARPAESNDRAFSGQGDIEVAQVRVGGTAARRAETLLLLALQAIGKRFEVRGSSLRALAVVQNELAVLAALEARVKGLNVLQDRRRGRCLYS